VTLYYSDDSVTLYHGDCRDVLPSLGTVDLVLTDPPYGVGYDPGNGSDAPSNRPNVEAALSGCGGTSLLAFGTLDRYVLPTWDWRWSFVWHKPMTRMAPAWGMARHYEMIHWYTRGAAYARPAEPMSDVQEANPPIFRVNPETVGHPAQKPASLLRRFLFGTGTVLDPFAGSGTTLRAAKDLGRRAIGIEIEERYCEIAARRLSQEVLAFSSGDEL
jgi:DNA modification methylase